MTTKIVGSTATDIAESIRDQIDQGQLAPGELLPSVRALAEQLGLNRNTVVAAYRQLGNAGLVLTQGRAGTRVSAPSSAPQEGFAADTRLRDLGTGNPDPELFPDITQALQELPRRAVLYGEPVIDEELRLWARDWFASDLAREQQGQDFRITVTSGAVDAIERLLSQTLTRDDAVGLEDPCFLGSIQMVRLGGYRVVSIPVDTEGMTVEGLRTALDQGIRALIVTPRAQNPTGASLSKERAAALREVLADYPYVLVIEDDHFSMLAQSPHRSIVGPGHERWALVRSVSKFLGPDMCLALTASDPDTADRLALRLSPGTTWVSHLLQRLTRALLTDEQVRAGIRDAGRHYAQRNQDVASRLTRAGVPVSAGEGLSLWVDVGSPARNACEAMMRRGWLARSGDDFVLDEHGSHHLRLTVHDLPDADVEQLVKDLVEAFGPKS